MQAAAETSVNAAALLFDSLIEEINATGTVTPKLAALCELAPITAQALPIGTPFELATPPLKQAA